MKKCMKVLIIFLVISMVLPGLSEAALSNGETKRLSGSNRVLTAINVSKEAYKGGAETIILSGYNGSADALTGTLLASDNNAPLLLSSPGGKVSKELKDEIIRLGAKKIYILGGNNAVPKSIETELEAMKINIERLSGLNRFATAVSIAEKASNKKEIFLALGQKRLANGREDALADALSIGPASAKKGMPVLLTQKDKLPKETKDAIKSFGVTNITIVGGPLAISKTISKELKNMGIEVTRKEGINRFDTSSKIAKDFFTDSNNTIVASGMTDTDALVGGYLGALYNSPVLLTNSKSLPIETKQYLRDFSKASYVLGGEAVINKSVFNSIKDTYREDIVEDDRPITIDQVPYNIEILKPNSIGTVWMEATYKNNTKYPITSMSMRVLLKDTNKTGYLTNYDTVLPGQTSPIFDGFGPSTLKKEDYEILDITVSAENINGKTIVMEYDTRLKKYEYMEYESDKVNTGIITVDQVPYNIEILKPNSIGTVWMEATYKNNTKYPITSMSMRVLLKDTNKTGYLTNYDTVLPGQTSPIFDGFGPSTLKKEDYEILDITVSAENINGKIIVMEYDTRLKKYEYMEY